MIIAITVELRRTHARRRRRRRRRGCWDLNGMACQRAGRSRKSSCVFTCVFHVEWKTYTTRDSCAVKCRPFPVTYFFFSFYTVVWCTRGDRTKISFSLGKRGSVPSFSPTCCDREERRWPGEKRVRDNELSLDRFRATLRAIRRDEKKNFRARIKPPSV